jgi:hypothetical protein
MSGVHTPILSFERGIEGILQSRTQDPALPQYSPLVPWDGRVEEKVQELMQTPTREEQLLHFLGPEHVSPDSLTPALFRGLLASSLKRLRKRAREQEVFEEAVAVLEDLDAASRLLEAYRNSLRQA